jgi:hypothetical protein
MTQILDIRQETESGEQTLIYEALRGSDVRESEVERFVSELLRMTSEERISASRYTMNHWEYWVYAGRFPDEVPTVNGELERIALTLE